VGRAVKEGGTYSASVKGKKSKKNQALRAFAAANLVLEGRRGRGDGKGTTEDPGG